MKKLLVLLFCAAAVFAFADDDEESDEDSGPAPDVKKAAPAKTAAAAPTTAPNPVQIVRGKVNRLQATGAATAVIVVDLPPAQGKLWGDRMEVPWGTNFRKNGQPVERSTNVVVGEDITIVTNGDTVIIYLGDDAKNIGADGNPVAAAAFKFKPMEKPKSKEEIRKAIRTRDDARKALREGAITGQEYLKMYKELPGN